MTQNTGRHVTPRRFAPLAVFLAGAIPITLLLLFLPRYSLLPICLGAWAPIAYVIARRLFPECPSNSATSST